jgi:hypothetical protein
MSCEQHLAMRLDVFELKKKKRHFTFPADRIYEEMEILQTHLVIIDTDVSLLSHRFNCLDIHTYQCVRGLFFLTGQNCHFHFFFLWYLRFLLTRI